MRVRVLLLVLVLAVVAAIPLARAATITVSAFGNDGWMADDTRSSSGVDLVGLNYTHYGKPGQTPTLADDAAIAGQIQFVFAGPASTPCLKMAKTSVSGGYSKCTLSKISETGFAAMSDLNDPGFFANYRYYTESTAEVTILKLGVRSTRWGTGSGYSQNGFTAVRSGEPAWDLILVDWRGTNPPWTVNAWDTLNTDKDTDCWKVYRQGTNSFFNAPPAVMQSLADWAAETAVACTIGGTDYTWGDVLFGSGATVNSIEFGVGSSAQTSNSYIDWIETSLLNGGDRVEFDGPPPPVHNVTQHTYYTTIQAAVTAANPGDEIDVAAGTYNETVSLQKSLRLIGAGAAATTWRGAAITQRPLRITRNNTTPANIHVEIAGFRFECENNQAIFADWSTSYTQAMTLDIHNNRFAHVNTRNPGNDFALWVDGALQTPRATQGAIRVYDNEFNLITGGVLFENCRAVDVLNNTFLTTYEAVTFNYYSNSSACGEQLVTGNTFNYSDIDWGFAMNNWHGSGTYTILPSVVRNNTFGSGFYYAILYGVEASQASTHDFTIYDNAIPEGLVYVWGDYANQVMLNASGNWWGSAASPSGRTTTGRVDYTPWLASGSDTGDPGFQGDFSALWVDDGSPQTGTVNLVQEAIDLVSGSTVYLAPGTYTGAVNVNKKVTLEGSGNGSDPATSTILNGGGAVGLTLAASGTSTSDRLTLRNFRVTGSTNGLRIDGTFGHILVDDLYVVNNSSYGFEIHNFAVVNDLVLEGSTFTSNGGPSGMGMRVRGSVTGFRATDCHFDATGYGFESVAGCGESAVFDDVQFTNCTFSDNLYKGAYFEKLSHAVFTDCVVNSSGGGTTSPGGINVNVKYGTYTDITFNRVRVTNCGNGLTTGTGFYILGRNDGSYAPCPASLTGVHFVDVLVSGCPIGVIVQNNVTDIDFTSSVIQNNSVAGMANLTDGTEVIDALGCWWGAASGPYHATLNPTGTGNAVSDRVLFQPFLTGNIVVVPDPQQITTADAGAEDWVTIHYLGGLSGPLYGYSLRLTFPSQIDITQALRPLSGPFASAAIFQPVDMGSTWVIDAALGGSNPGTTGPCDLCRVKVKGLSCTSTGALLDLTVLNVRDSNNQSLTGAAADDGLVLVDLGAPTVTAGTFVRTNLPDNGYVKNGDTMTLTVTIDDPCSGVVLSGITANLTSLGGGATVAPDSYVGGVATWTFVVTGSPDGTKTVSVTATDGLGNSTTLNPAGSVYLDNTPPTVAVTGLTAAPGHNRISLAWTNPSGDPDTEAYGVMIRRVGWGAYPDYSAVPEPAYPDSATGTRVLQGTGMPESFFDVTFTGDLSGRDVYHYQAFVFDKAYNYGGGSGGARATSYWLGDVDPVNAPTSIGDGLVQFSYDVTTLSANYYLPYGTPGWNAHCDVGPTHNGSRLGIPMPDHAIQFEDLMIFSMNYGVVAPLQGSAPGVLACAAPPTLTLRVPSIPTAGTFTASLLLSENRSVVKGLHGRIAYDRQRLELVRVEKGALTNVDGVFFASVPQTDAVVVDASQLGEGLAFAGSGEVARLTFRVRGAARPTLVEADLRDAANRTPGTHEETAEGGAPSAPAETVARTLPTRLEFSGALPNPFNGRTDLRFALPAEGAVALRIFDVSGRLVRTLADGAFPAGEHRVSWDGRTDDGQRLGAGIYLAEFRTSGFAETRKLFLMR